jgi:hypothetical protein
LYGRCYHHHHHHHNNNNNNNNKNSIHTKFLPSKLKSILTSPAERIPSFCYVKNNVLTYPG